MRTTSRTPVYLTARLAVRVPCLVLLALLVGCQVLGWNSAAYARAWDEFTCDRRIAEFVNLRLETDSTSLRGGNSPNCMSPSGYNAALAYLHARGVSEVIFSGLTTAHGTIAEFRALNAGFSSVPDRSYKTGHATIEWNVKRTYRFAPEDVRGKYHPSTFWSRIFNTPWSDDYVSSADAESLRAKPSSLMLYSHYGKRCHIQQLAYLTHTDETGLSKKTTRSWDVVREWDEESD